MTYLDSETSVHDGEPIELYLFEAPNAVTYTYTSGFEAVVKGSKTYEPIPIKRTKIKVFSQNDVAAIDIEMPMSTPLIVDFAFGVPVRDLDLTIFRRHGTGPDIDFWKGKITAIKTVGNIATVKSPSRLSVAFKTSIPSVYYQKQCNHPLYGIRCGASRAAFKTTTTIVTGGAGVTSLIVASDGGNPDDFFTAGEIVRVIDGESRMIIDHTDDTVVITHPFKELDVGNTVELFAGCDHTLETCKTKFNLVVNFGGHNQIPDSNPFETGLK